MTASMPSGRHSGGAQIKTERDKDDVSSPASAGGGPHGVSCGIRGEDIAAHGAIGNLRSVALVSKAGAIDYLCHPRLDSPSIFCALLDQERGGAFTVEPVEHVTAWTTRQLYIPDTNVLVTRFMSVGVTFEVIDFMPIMADAGPISAVVRRVACIRGEVTVEARCAPRFDYGRQGSPDVDADKDGVLFRSRNVPDGALSLRSDVRLRAVEGAAAARFALRSGEIANFILECGFERPSGCIEPGAFAEAAFEQTIAFWQNWSAQSSYRGRWREDVMRSALVLKMLTSADHGSIAAAATFGLPEQPGGGRNWDYRFCWIRDAAFTTFALMRLGYTGEATRFNAWIAQRADESRTGDLQILYRLDGSSQAKESELAHLAGYGGATPVRIGNAAAGQLQLDIYGALFDSTYLSDKYGGPVTFETWERMSRVLNWLCRNWNQPDEGIWEVRGERRHFLSSRLMCWVALDRALRLVRKRSLPAEDEAVWAQNRTLIYRDIHENFWDAERGAFVQYRGGTTLDAAALLMPLVRFIAPRDPRWLSTQRAIERELVSDVLVRRYETGSDNNVDGLSGEEGVFTPCCFWFVECLARSGEVRRARLHFEKLVSYANELGLFSEEIGPGGEQLGNTPQALTHLALISAAYTLDGALDRTGSTPNGWRQYD